MGYVNKIQLDENTAHLVEPTLYGTCSTAAATAIKDVTLNSFTLTTGVQVAVKFTVTNTAAVADLKLRVNSNSADDAKPIKYRGANLSDKGTLANKRIYLFVYDGTNWELVGDIDTNSNTVQRVFRSSSNVELPIAGINASNSATATYNTSSSIGSGSYAGMYGAIPNTVANLATINPSTGKITVPGGVVADLTGNASTATNVALSGVTDAEDLQAIEALTGTEGFLKKTAENTWSLDDTDYLPLAGGTLTGRVVTAYPIKSAITGTGTVGSFTNNTYYPAKWTFNTDITLQDQDIITVKTPVAGHDYGVFLSVDNGTTYYPVVLNGTSRLTTQYPAGSYLVLIFDSNASAASMFAVNGQASSTRVTVAGGAWRILNYYDSGNSGIYQNYNTKAYKVGSTAITAYDLIAEDNNGYLIPAHKVAHRIGSPIFIRDAAISANATGSWISLYDRHYSLTIRNSGTSLSLTTYAPVFLKGTVSGGLFTPDTTTPFISTKANCNTTGAYYMYIGDATGASTVSFNNSHPYYYYNGTNLVLYTEYAGNAGTVNGHTVEHDVPSNPVFTDTWDALSTSQAGYVAQAPNDTTKFLRGDASWAALPTASTETAGIIQIGTGATNAAPGNHTHTYLPKSGGVMTGNIRRYYGSTSTEPMITMLSNNQDIILWEAGHGSSAATTTTSNHYKLIYKGTGSDNDNSNYLQLVAHKTDDVIAVQIDEAGNVSLPQMNLGSSTKPIYLNNGVITECSEFLTATDSSSLSYLKLNGSNAMSGDINVITGDTDKFLNFWYSSNQTAGGSWRTGMLGTGSSDTNYFVIESGTNTTSATTWNRALQIGQNSYDAGFGGNVYPITTNAKTLGTSTKRWLELHLLATSNATTNGIVFTSGSSSGTTRGRIGVNANGLLGLYGQSKVAIRADLSGSTGVEVVSNAMYPTDSMTLGSSTNQWTQVYATTYYGSLSTSFIVKVASGTTEGTDLYTYNGSAAKTLDIIAGSNITLTPGTNQLTINATDTTYSVFHPSGTGSSAGLVPDPGTTAGTTKFLCEDGEWKTVSTSDVNVTQNILADSNSNCYPILVSNYQQDATTTTAAAVNRVQSIYVQPSTGTVFATVFSGSGASLTSLNASNISSGILDLDYLEKGSANTALMGNGNSSSPSYVSVSPSITITAGATASDAPTVNVTVLGVSGTAKALTKASTTGYGVTKLSAIADDATLAATAKSVYDLKDYVNALLATADALVFKGVITSNNNIPATGYSAGWTYKVGTAGTYIGEACEVGDLIIAISDPGENQSSQVNSHWAVIQNNVDGAVFKGDRTFSNKRIIISDGTEGKVKDTPFEIDFTLNNSAMTAGSIHPTVTNVATLGKSDKVWNNVYATTFTGALTGNADTATQVYVTAAAPSSGTAYYLTYTTSTTSGNQNLYNKSTVRAYLGGTKDYLCIGNSSKGGGVTIYGSTNYTDIVTSASGGTNRTVTFPNVSGWIAVGGNGSSTGVGGTTTPAYLDTDGVLKACNAYTTLFTKLSWTAGTSSGPVLDVTVGGTNKTATIPSASESASGIVTNAAQTFGGIKAFYRESTTENNYAAGIAFINKDTTTGQTQDTAYIRAYNTHATNDNGMNMVIQSAGNVFIGGGESPGSVYATLKTSTAENLYCTADGTVYIEANANTIANRIGIAINTSGAIVPVKAEANNNNAQDIGTSSNKWANVYATTFTGDLTGKVNNITLTAQSTGFTISGGTTSKTLTVNQNCTLNGGSSSYLAYYSAANSISGHGAAHFSDTYSSSSANGKNELVLGNSTGKASNGSAWGQLALYSEGTKGTYLKSAENSTAWYTLTMPAKTGTICLTDGTGASGTWGISITGNAATATTLTGSHAYRSSLTKGTNPSSTTWTSSWFNYQTGSGSAVADRIAGGIESMVDANGSSNLYLRAYRYASGSSDNNYLVITCAKDGTCTYSVANAANFRSAIGAGTSSLTIGTTASTAAAGNHNHNRAGVSKSWYQGRDSAIIKTTSYSGYDAILSMKTTDGDWALGVYTNNIMYFTYILDSNYSSNSNTVTKQFIFNPNGTLTATTFSGALSGNATTSSGVLDIGNTSKTTTFAYSKAGLEYADYTWLAAWNGYELRAVNKSQFAQASHSHSYLPLSGGQMTGAITFTTAASAAANSTPTALSYGRLQSYGNLCLNANTDNSGTEYVILTSGHGASGSTADGMWISSTNAGLETGDFYVNNGSLWAGTNGSTTAERDVGVRSGAGAMYMYSVASTTGNRGIWLGPHGTATSGKSVFVVDTNNNVTFYGSLSGHASSDLALSGGTMSGTLAIVNNTQNNATYDALLYIEHKSGNDWGAIINKNSASDYGMQILCTSTGSHGLDVTGRITGTKVYGAVWNDYAEYRQGDIIEGGYCVTESADGIMRKSTKRLQPGCRITSDTFGFAIGETEKCKTPIAVCGRVLVYPYRNPIHYQLGAPVCSAPDGTVDIMSRDEAMMYPERIVGTVSEIPTYDVWECGEGKDDTLNHRPVNGRIWIYVR